ncbi:MAG: sugar phosphate isomerase/epimerase [Clostridia bacterium]|nr:sugar phosphate isomerase/epimerase [Clostridia bacterium]
MKIGVCSSYVNWRSIADVGYDYIEGNMTEIATATDEEFEEIRKTACTLPIKVETTNCFFPSDVILYSYKKDGSADIEGFKKKKEEIGEYAVRALSRVRELGVKISVIGSGSARAIPDSMAPAVAEEQFIEIIKLIGEIASMYGVRLCLEPLRRAETDFINTYAESFAFAKKLADKNIATMIDFYHQAENGEPLDTFVSAGKDLVHTHIAAPITRQAITESDLEYFTDIMKHLHNMGYTGRMSLEASIPSDFVTSIKATLPLMRKLSEVVSGK